MEMQLKQTRMPLSESHKTSDRIYSLICTFAKFREHGVSLNLLLFPELTHIPSQYEIGSPKKKVFINFCVSIPRGIRFQLALLMLVYLEKGLIAEG